MQEQNETPNGFSRRTLLGLAALGAVALAGCEMKPGVLISDLPEGNALDTGYFPPTPQGKLPAPPVGNVQTNSSGIILRSAWARGGPVLSRVNPIGDKRLITFHHSGDPKPFLANTTAETAQHLEYVREYHLSRNFSDIGYHFAIDRAGRVWQLRSLQYEGQHVRYHNENNIGVVVLGNFDLQTMTDPQKQKVQIFGAMLRKQYNLPISRVYTHRELVSTECPGTNMQPYMAAVRKQGLI